MVFRAGDVEVAERGKSLCSSDGDNLYKPRQKHARVRRLKSLQF